MKSHKHIYATVLQWVVILGIYLYTLVSTYNSGQQRSFYLLLAVIPLFFICWVLSLLLTGKPFRDISKNLTDEERAESNRLASSYGSRVGLFVAAPFGIMSGCLYSFFNVRSFLIYVVLFCFVMLLASPFMYRHWKSMRSFMLSTAYAKKHGYLKE